MRNFIILNGKDSRTINGLLIRSLPPISKPLLRTQIEQIDGRDGDIITPLGYAAYEKSITIGLYGNYDVDDVIAYFNGSGMVTFSNEPDKYYNYQIIQKIDFEKLIRFKTATVAFYVQPFKYKLNETPLTFNVDSVNKSFTVNNSGNYFAKPIMTIYGSGNIAVNLNDSEIFNIAIGDTGYITIDTAQMEAYQDGTLRNRLVIGDYNNFMLNTGENTVSFSGDVTQVVIEKYARWL